jgi:hypothetical protein
MTYTVKLIKWLLHCDFLAPGQLLIPMEVLSRKVFNPRVVIIRDIVST